MRGLGRHGGLIELKELRTMMWNDGMSWTGWLYMGVFTLAFWALVVFAVVALFKGARPGPSRGHKDDFDAAKILDQRFARGEIDADEYHSRQNVLRSAH
jgi:putative membrane protein